MNHPIRTLLRRALSCAAFVGCVVSVSATDYFATPTGAGAQDGLSWASAYPQAQIQAAVTNLQPGDTLNIGSGTYTLTGLTISGSGTAGNPKSIVGVDTGGGRPLFQGTFNVANDANGARFIYVPGAAHYWTFRNLAFKNYGWTISLALVSSGDDTLRSNFVFEDLSFDTIEDAIRLYNINHVEVTNCTAIRYTKKAFRFGDHTSFVTFTNCFADCSGGDPAWVGKPIPVGFGGDDTAQAPIIHDITLVDCVALNHGYPQGSSNYWNGDGFSSERGTYNVQFIRCKAYGNNDAGFDNKASNVLYQDCVSADNSRGFRHWADGGQMFNCVAAYNIKKGGNSSSYGLWVSGNGGEITVDFSTLHNSASSVYAESGGSVVVNDSILSHDNAGGSLTSGPVTLNNTVSYRPGTGTDPVYVAADPTWHGEPVNAMDSETYGLTKGYNSGRVDETPNSPPTVGIAATPLSGTAPLTVSFVASAADSDGFIVGYLWTFGDGQTSTEMNPTVTYGSPGTFTATCKVVDNRGAQATDTVVITAGVPTTPVELRIESGSTSAYTDTLGRVWSADYGYGSGGGIADRGAIEITGTDDDRLYQTERWGVSNYALLVANGTYEVRLHFAETYSGITAAGQRVFSVTVEDTAPAGWTDIDVFGETGGRNVALIKSGLVTVADNILDLVFTAVVDNPMVNAIEIIPAAPGDMPPVPPAGLVATDIAPYSFTLSWSPTTDDVGVAGYEVFRNGVLVGMTAGTSLAQTGLSPYTSYAMTVRARDTSGNGSAPSEPLVVKTLNDGTVGDDIIIDNADALGVTFTGAWPTSTYNTGYHASNYSHDNNGGKGSKSARFTPDFPEAGTYTVYLWWPADANRASNVPVDITHAGGTTTVDVNQRTNGSTWFPLGTFAMAAGTDNSVLLRTTGTNGFVIADAVRFLRGSVDSESPSIPAGLAASNITTHSFTLSWAASTDNVAVTGYEIFLDGASVATSPDASVALGGLDPGTTYAATVRARDAVGNWSAPSAPLSVSTQAVVPDTQPPTVPTGLAASNIGSSSFTLSWAASTDDVGVAGYEVFLDGVSVALPAGTSAGLTGLSPDTAYSVAVRAFDAADNASAASAPLNVTTTTAPGGGNGAVISVNLTNGGTNLLERANIVGAVPAANWINSPSANQSLSNVVDNSGAATTADITFGNTSFGYINNTPELAEPMTDDAKMMRSQRAQSNSGTMSMVAAQVPYTAYDVYVYWGGRTPQETVPLTMTVNFQLSDGSGWVTNATKYIRDTNRVWDGTYDESTATTAAEAVDGQEYVVFRDVFAPTFRLSATSGSRTGICGIQIVEQGAQAAPPPAITSPSSASGTYGAPLTYTITATEDPASYAAEGLPEGLVIDTVTGVISGTPAAAGEFAVTLGATNTGGTGTATLALSIAQASQTIAFPNPGPKAFGDAPFALGADASSGLPVTYAITSGPAELSGGTVSLNGAGTVSITASQNGDANIAPAEPVSVSFEVAKASTTITLGGLWQLYDGQARTVTAATDPAGLDVVLTYGGGSMAPVYPGSYAVEAVVDDPNHAGVASGTLVVGITALVRHAPALNGGVDGSVQVLAGEAITLNSTAYVSGDLLVPGSPGVQINGQPTFAGVIEGPGGDQPSNFSVTLNSGSVLRHLVRRIDPIELPAVGAPPAPIGTRNVVLNSATDDSGDFATLRNLTLNGNVGARAIPPGTYGAFTVNGGGALVLGVAGSADPAFYNLQSLTLNGQAHVHVVGPVVLTLASGVTFDGTLGNDDTPEWLLLRVASGGVTLNGAAALHGFVEAPGGTVAINGGATLVGLVKADRLVLNGNGVVVEPSL